MADYRDPKVTNSDRKSGGAMRWVWIALGVLLLLLLLAWLFGAFDNEVAEVEGAPDAAVIVEEGVDADPDAAVVVEEEAEVEPDAGVVVEEGETEVPVVPVPAN